MLPDKAVKCHRTAFTKSCYDGVVKCKCRLWCHVDGLDAMGRQVDVWGCSDELSIKFLHEIAKEIRHATASTDKVATEVRKANDASTGLQTYLVNGIKASFPLLRLASETPLLEHGSGDEEQ